MTLAILVALPTTAQASDVLRIDDEIPVVVKLGCRGHVEEGAGAVACRWHPTTDRAVASWQLWNLQVRPELGARTLVAELGVDASGYRDTNVDVPAAYVYAVLALDADGEVIGRSRVVKAVLHERDRAPEPLHLGCDGQSAETNRTELDAAAPDHAIWVTCEWRPATSDLAAGYVVWRSIDDGERSVIARTGLEQTAIRDDDVAAGHRYRYVVQAVDADGNLVGQSRSVSIAFRPHDRPTPEVEVRRARDVDLRPERDLVRDH